MSISRFSARILFLLALVAGVLVFAGRAGAQVFSVASDPGPIVNGNGSNIMGQSFSPSVNTAPEDPTGYTATPSPQPAAGATVYLTSFQFTYEGTFGTPAAGSANTYLIIEDTGPTSGYANFSTLNTTTVTGVSTNSVNTTSSVAQGTPLVWTFNNLPVTYGDYLTAAMATVSGTTFTFIPANIELVQYTDVGGTYYPDFNYGTGPAADSSTNTTSTGANYNAAAFYTYGGSYFGAGSDAEDATFTANFLTAVPEPVSAAMVGLLSLVLVGRRRVPTL
jgi:hypothetical protein